MSYSLCHYDVIVIAGAPGVSGGETREKSANDRRQETDCSPGSVAMETPSRKG